MSTEPTGRHVAAGRSRHPRGDARRGSDVGTGSDLTTDGDPTTGSGASAGPEPDQGVEGARARFSIHREPVVAIDDRVLGYTITVVPDAAAAELHHLAQALQDEYLHLDLRVLVADRLAFVPATPAMLDGFLPGEGSGIGVVLDLPPGFEHTDEPTARLTALRALGARLALGGFTGAPAQLALLPHVQYVTVDPRTLGVLTDPVVRQAHAAGVRVLATNVPDPESQTSALVAGVDALRGLMPSAHPTADPVPTKVLRPGQLQCLAALHLLHQADVDLAEVGDVIDTDPVLTLRVLHLVNSGAFSLRTQVDTAQRAVVLLGVREVTGLVAALALDSRPGAMDRLWTILTRAMACEAIAGDGAAYTVGMLSALIEELGVPADVVLDKVGVSSALAEAIRDQTGELGQVLAAVVAHERRDEVGVVLAGFQPTDVSDVYLACLGDALRTAQIVEP